MARALLTIFGLGVVFILVALSLPWFLPLNKMMDNVRSDVSEKTGRELNVNGQLSFQIFPSIRLTATDVTLSNPPGFSSPNFATLDKFSVSVKLIPLFSGEIEVDRFILDHPRIAVETLADGRTNMEMNGEAGRKAKADKIREAAEGKSGAKTGQAQLPNGLKLKEVKLVDGTFTMVDHRTGAKQELDDINVSVRLAAIDDELVIDGSVKHRGNPYKITLGITPFDEFMMGHQAGLRLNAQAARAVADFTGKFHTGVHSEIAGQLNVDAPSVPELLKLGGIDPPAMYGDLGALKLATRISADRKKADLKEIKMSLGPIGAEGELEADLQEKVPLVAGKLRVTGTSGIAAGISVPMLVSGPINEISARPDVEGLVKEKLGDPAGLVNELVKMKSKPEDKPAENPEAVAKDLINGLIKK